MARYIGIVSSCETGSFDDIEVVRFLADALSNSCPSTERYLITRIVQEQKTFLLQIFPKNIDVLGMCPLLQFHCTHRLQRFNGRDLF